MSLQSIHDKLLAWATADERKGDLLEARRTYFGRYGEPHEEDKSYDVRMNGMLDYYLYDYRRRADSERVIDRFLRDQTAALSPDEIALYRELAQNVHGLFEVRRIRPAEIRLRDVFTGGEYDVTERRQIAGLEKGDLIEARLIPYEGRLFFSGSFLFHPRAVRKPVLAQVKRLKKEAGRDGLPDVPGFLGQLSRMAFKLERYRNVKIESIYDFSQDSRTLTPGPTPRVGR